MNTTMNDDRLKVAAEEGNINLLYTLIQEDPHVLDCSDLIPFFETPLHIAASAGHLQFATEVMRLKPSLALKLNQKGCSPIHLALQYGQRRMVQRFVDINKNQVRVKGREGITPLHFVTQNGDIDLLANFLLACPDSIQDVTVRSETALHIAVKNQQYEALQVLVGWVKRTHHRGAMQLEERILNSKDEEGNTILHISALLDESQALELLINSNMDLEAKNLENLTALDIAASAEIKDKLQRIGVKCGSSITESPTLAHELKLKIRVMDKLSISILRIRREISEDQRNALLVVAALVATATYQAALNPPGGYYQANTEDNNNNNNTTTTTCTQGKAGKSVMSEADFFALSIMNTMAFLVSTTIIYILTPSGILGRILSLSPMYLLAGCYIFSMTMISPSSASYLIGGSLLFVCDILFFLLSHIFGKIYKRLEDHAQNREIKPWNGDGGNRW